MPPTLTLTQSAEEQEAEQQPQTAEELILSSLQAKFDTFISLASNLGYIACYHQTYEIFRVNWGEV